jgi:nuclear transport factor 2 (NTF2) superfamily protein
MKLKHLPLIILIIVNFGCKENSERSDSNSIQNVVDMETNKWIDFGKDYANAWSSQHPERVASFFAPDGSLKVNDGEPAVGTEAITLVAKGFMDAFPDMVVAMDTLVIESNKTLFHWTLTGTNNVPGGTGNKVKISGFEEWTFNNDGLVQESLGHYNAEEYLRQLNGTGTQ